MPINPLSLTDPLVTVKTSLGSFTVELFPTKAPVTVNNFLTYSNGGFYTDTLFHRVIDGFMVQAGQTVVTAMNGTTVISVADKIPLAPIVLESQAGLSNTRGTIAMARQTAPDTATSQFFVNTVDNSAKGLDYQSAASPGYAVFGTVLQGMETIDKISKVPTFVAGTRFQNFPTTPITILSTKNAIINGIASNKAEALFGTTNDDTISALAGDDDLYGDSGNDTLDGGAGLDTANYQGLRTNYTITTNAQTFQVTDSNTTRDGSDSITGIERLIFSDKSVALDIAGNAGQAYRLYQAAFNRAPDAAGLGYWINLRDKGTTNEDVAAGFLSSPEFQALVGTAPTANTLVTAFYNNVLHRAPDQAGLTYWTDLLANNQLNNAQVLTGFSESAENQLQVLGAIQNGIDFIV